MTMTGLELSEKVLEETKMPMSCSEIWQYAVSKGYNKESNLRGKTPWSTLGAQIYTYIQSDKDCPFIKLSSSPQKFGLKKITYDLSEKYTEVVKTKNDIRVVERDLHPLLVSYVNSDEHFHAHVKTIFHESSSKTGRNEEKWMHPDLVAVSYPFDDLNQTTINLAKHIGLDTIRVFSFEMKRKITSGNVREYYFQAVSNSSWANEGYLVAPYISPDAMDQLGRLNSSFGIGVIRLNTDDVHQSEIIIPSRENELDIGMINDLVEINPDFSTFISNINDNMGLNHFVGGSYDSVIKDEDLEKYIIQKRIRDSI